MPSEATSAKRKQPPTFRHLPAKRAKTLKRIWVQNKKIKTQWKAQKRKEGVYGRPNEQEEDSGSESDSNSEHEKLPSEREQKDLLDEEIAGEMEPTRKGISVSVPASAQHPTREKPQRPVQQNRDRLKRRKVAGGQGDADANADRSEPSLRELTREAYSRSSLHTFKARQRGGNATGRSGSHGHGLSGSEQNAGTGRGQPNMKLRMNVMLEKIKRTMT